MIIAAIVVGNILLVLVVLIAFAAWLARDLTTVERVAVFGHPEELDLGSVDI